jgi:hypothetical protein
MNYRILMNLWDVGVRLRIGMDGRRIAVWGRVVGMRGGICVGDYRIYMWHSLASLLSKSGSSSTCQLLVHAAH